MAHCATFHPTPEFADGDIDELTRAIRQRVLRFLRRYGELADDGAPADDPSTLDPCVLQVLGAAAEGLLRPHSCRRPAEAAIQRT
jgi:hypothetical protein